MWCWCDEWFGVKAAFGTVNVLKGAFMARPPATRAPWVTGAPRVVIPGSTLWYRPHGPGLLLFTVIIRGDCGS